MKDFWDDMEPDDKVKVFAKYKPKAYRYPSTVKQLNAFYTNWDYLPKRLRRAFEPILEKMKCG